MKTKTKIRIPHNVIVRAPGLLPMLYTLPELVSELGIPYSTLRNWLDAGAPHIRDNRGHIYINGQIFAVWIKEKKKQTKPGKLSAEEGNCMHCNQVVPLFHVQVSQVRKKLIHKVSKCPECGGKVIRGDRYDRTKELSES